MVPSEDCPMNCDTVPAVPAPVEAPTPVDPYGPWMLVEKRRRNSRRLSTTNPVITVDPNIAPAINPLFEPTNAAPVTLPLIQESNLDSSSNVNIPAENNQVINVESIHADVVDSSIQGKSKLRGKSALTMKKASGTPVGSKRGVIVASKSVKSHLSTSAIPMHGSRGLSRNDASSSRLQQNLSKPNILDPVKHQAVKHLESANPPIPLPILTADLEQTLDQEELLWKQKSRSDWISFGDRNTSYFHKKAITNRRRNHITSLQLESGEWCSDEDALCDAVAFFFQKLYLSDDYVPEKFPLLGCFPSLLDDDMHLLELMPTDVEIKDSLFAMASLKSPGLWKLSKGNEVGEAINVIVDRYTSNVEGVQLGEDINEVVVGNAVNDEGINEVGAGNIVDDEVIKDVSTDHSADINVELLGVEDLGDATNEDEVQVGEKETSQDSADFLVNVEVASNLDDEVEGIRVNFRVNRHESLTDASEGEDNNNVECEGRPNVGNDLVEEDEDVPEIEGKLQDHESDYIEFDEPSEYGESDDELGLRFENHKQFKVTVRKYVIAKGVALRFKNSEPKRQHCGKELGVYASFNKCQRTRLNLLSEKKRENDNKTIFHIFFNALKKGWKDGCLPIIGVDNCFFLTVTQIELLHGQLRKEKEIIPRSDVCKAHIFQLAQKMKRGEHEDPILKLNGCHSTDDMMEIPPLHWSRVMLEEIRKMIMQRIHVKRSWVSK
ncbi:hypothetical protein GQ457_09G013800 [Hibiscus cannabinus]